MMDRRNFLKATASAPAVPLMTERFRNPFGSSDVFSPVVSTQAGILGFDVPQQAMVTGSDQNPEWIVHYTLDGDEGEDKHDSLKAWVDSSDSREIVREYPSRGRMTIRAALEDVGPSFMDTLMNQGLQSRDWVESIDIALSVEKPSPVDELIDEDDFEPGFNNRERARAFLNSHTPDGIAFDGDADTVSMDDVRGLIGGEI